MFVDVLEKLYPNMSYDLCIGSNDTWDKSSAVITGDIDVYVQLLHFNDLSHLKYIEELYSLLMLENSKVLLTPYDITVHDNILVTKYEYIPNITVPTITPYQTLIFFDIVTEHINHINTSNKYYVMFGDNTSYYDKDDCILVHCDTNPTNIYDDGSNLLMMDLDSIFMVESRHRYDSFLYEWFIERPYKKSRFDVSDISEFKLFVESYIYPRLTQYNNITEFYCDFITYCKMRHNYFIQNGLYDFGSLTPTIKNRILSFINHMGR